MKKDDNQVLQVRDHEGNLQNIKQLNPEDAGETLGVFQSANGSEKAQVTKLTKKATEWVGNIKKSGLRPDEARCAIDSTIRKTLLYCLPATAMT